ncbi:MAG: hypothetical protein OEY56_09340 [Cyclobacteriaceae bacterium]|nr:hypothetical protein [Cyclobacteriaceae bacterium]
MVFISPFEGGCVGPGKGKGMSKPPVANWRQRRGEGHFSWANPRHLHQLVVMTTFTMDRKAIRGMLEAVMEWVYWKLF